MKDKITTYDQDSVGRGVGKLKDKVVFINSGLKDEEYTIDIVFDKNNYSEANIVSIKKQSDERRKYDCPFIDCGGCDLGHQKYDYQLVFKYNKVKKAIERIGGLKDINILDVIPSSEVEYRNKVVLNISDDKIGFYKNNTHEVIDISSCIICNKKINELIVILKQFIAKYKDHNIKNVFIRSEDETMINIIADNFKLKKELIEHINNKVNSILINGKVIHGERYIIIELLGYKFKVSSESFFQINKEQTEKLYNKVLDYSKKYKGVALDLYCGVGTITALLSKHFKKVIGIEEVKSAVFDAKENMEINNIDNVEFICGKVEFLLNKIEDKVDLIVVDPPRNGLHTNTITSILNIKPKTVIYVSCNPETLARDLKVLSCEYIVNEISLFDMFPNTHHVETVVSLSKGKQ